MRNERISIDRCFRSFCGSICDFSIRRFWYICRKFYGFFGIFFWQIFLTIRPRQGKICIDSKSQRTNSKFYKDNRGADDKVSSKCKRPSSQRLLVNVCPPKEYIFDELYSWDEGSELSPVMFAWSAIDIHRIGVDVDSFCFYYITNLCGVVCSTWNMECYCTVSLLPGGRMAHFFTLWGNRLVTWRIKSN